MSPERFVIGDGIYLNILDCDKFKTNCISVDFLCNMAEDTVAVSALLPFVLARGTSRYPGMKELTKALDMLYGSRISAHFSKIGDTQYFGFTSYPLRSEYTDGIDVSTAVLKIIGEMIFSPYLENGALSAVYTESEKRVMIDRIQAQINDKNTYSVLRCREILSEGEAYALPETGTEAQVAAITAEALTARLFEARDSLPIEIYAIGKFDRTALLQTVKDIFRSASRRPPKPLTYERNGFRGEGRTVTEQQPVKQGKLCLGFRTGCYIGDRELPAYALFAEVLGGSPTSKLFMNVREKRSLCYYCSALSDLHKGIMIIASGIEVSDREAAEHAILEQIEQCRRGEISDAELSAARKSILNSAKTIYDDAGALKSWYMKRGLAGITESPLDYAERAVRTTVEEIAKIAQNLTLDTVYFLEGTLLQQEGEEEDA